MPITGLPMNSSRAKPISCMRERWPKARWLSGPNQRKLRSSSGCLRRWLMAGLPLCVARNLARMAWRESAGLPPQEPRIRIGGLAREEDRRLERDRKSVGEGKRVSVRVGLGGRRLIKKKKKQKKRTKN